MSKAPAKPAADGTPPAAGKSKKKLIIIIVVIVLVLGSVGAVAMILLSKKGASAKDKDKDKEHQTETVKAPVFLPLEAFVVNLQSDSGDKYLQVQMTLQVADEAQVTLIKTNMPQVRSRLLMLLSSKDVADILTPQGKDKLITEISAQVNLPFLPTGEPQKVSGVFFTSFVVQ